MAFYLLPPSGNISYRKLEDYGLNRLRFLLRLSCCRTPLEVKETLEDASFVNQSECLISGSSRDVVAHHILRLALCDDKDMQAFFCYSELALFKQRLADMGCKEWECFLQRTEKDLSQLLRIGIPSADSFLSDLDFVIGILNQEFVSWHTAAREICRQSEKLLQLPFHLVLGLVAKREVSLSKGLASVPLSNLHSVLGELFDRNMKLAMHQAWAQRDITRHDPRIRRLTSVFKRAYRAEKRASHHLPSSVPHLELSSLWSQAELFPPCMSSLMDALKREHRLAHNDRIQLTLFLKELGLSLHEALLLWKQEYSKQPSSPVTPNRHGWHGNERRYIYSIRHLYGLEGGRVNYSSHRCLSIQDRSLSNLDCGGCPFTSVEELQTSKTLAPLRHSPHFSEVKLLVQEKQCGMACALFMKSRLKLRQQSTNNARDLENNNDYDIHSEPHVQSSVIHGAESKIICNQYTSIEDGLKYSTISLCADRPFGLTDENCSLISHRVKRGRSTSVSARKKYRPLFKRKNSKLSTPEAKNILCLQQQDGDLIEMNARQLEECASNDMGCVSNEEAMAIPHIDIKKPSDYYRCYVTLLNGLKSKH